MHVSRLSLVDFRSYPEALLAPGPGFVILTGDNGAGKTNLLEAVSLLVPGRGLRAASLAEMARRGGAGGFAVAAKAARIDIGTGTLPSAPDRRQVRVNGVAASATSLSEWLSVLWLTPAMDRLFVETASARRRFLDRFVLALHPDHAANVSRYEAAMRSRNKLLADEAQAAPEWLAALETQMADHGYRIAQYRHRTVAALAERIEGQSEGPFPSAGLELAGWRMPPGGGAELAEALRKSRGADSAAGRCLVGPHRTDLEVTHIGKDQPAALCSTGEQKALLIGLVLAHSELVAARTDRAPILLLDEIAAHLDRSRREALFDRLQGLESQVWMTGTDADLFAGIGTEASWFCIAEGHVTKP